VKNKNINKVNNNRLKRSIILKSILNNNTKETNKVNKLIKENKYNKR